jgi:hypothetical protein
MGCCKHMWLDRTCEEGCRWQEWEGGQALLLLSAQGQNMRACDGVAVALLDGWACLDLECQSGLSDSLSCDVMVCTLALTW